MSKMKILSISVLILLIIAVVFFSPTHILANSFFWQGTDVSDSGDQGLIRYEGHKEIHDALLRVLPVELYPDGDYGDGSVVYDEKLDGLPNPNGRMQNGLVRMPSGELGGPSGLRIPCDSGKCWDGYTLIDKTLIDMDGNIVHVYEAASGSFGGAAKLLKGGDVISSERGNLVQRNWCGVEVKSFPGLSNHHDHQREPSSVGYYYPGQAAFTDRGISLSLGNVDVGYEQIFNPDTGDPMLEYVEPIVQQIVDVQRFDENRPPRPINDDVIREIPWDWDGTPPGTTPQSTLFEWHARDHFVSASPSDLGLGLFDDEAAHYALDLGLNSGGAGNFWSNIRFRRGNWSVHSEDWTHANTAAWLGNNIWYSKYQDERFHPDNIIADFRSLNNIIIIARHDHPEGLWKEGAIVWRLGPNYGTDGPDGQVGQIIGPHMAYMIPRSLPGAGNILVFDNGGGGGYGALIEGLTDPNTGEKLGFWMNKYRHFSRVLEINPMTKQIVWQYVQAKPTREDQLGNNHLFYSSIMSGAQRLPNGNTLIQEADTGRVFEVTTEGEVVWEYAPEWPTGFGIYRSYRIPYSWIPEKNLRDKDGNMVYDICE